MISIIILGIIQGVAEFLPISSSAHLIIFRDLFGVGANVFKEDLELTFDIALHFGTLLAIGIYFFKDFIDMIKKGFTRDDGVVKNPYQVSESSTLTLGDLSESSIDSKNSDNKSIAKEKEGKILWYLVFATIPAAIVGVLFEDAIDKIIRNNFIIIGCALIIMGIIIYVVDRIFEQKKEVKDMKITDAIIIGCAQVFALIPGFSRSGTTIAAGRALKLKREDAAKFSFYLSAPVVLGAVVLKLFDGGTLSLIMSNVLPFIVGIVTSFVIGLLCIKFLLKYLKKNNFLIFMIYRIILGLVVIIYSIIK